MKKLSVLLAIILCLSMLVACSGKHQCIDTPYPDDTGAANTQKNTDTEQIPPNNENIFTATVVIRKDDLLILYTSEPTGLYTLDISSLELIGCENGDIAAGLEVSIDYSGMIMETYPAKLGSPTSIKIIGGEKNNICEMYVEVAEELWKTDPGLNGEICALELIDDTLSEGQKRAIVYELTNRIGYETYVLLSSYDELVEQGHINEEYLYFENGALITITADKESNTGKKFSFNAKKWASGTGAIFFTDCKAESKNGLWSYKLGNFAIS